MFTTLQSKFLAILLAFVFSALFASVLAFSYFDKKKNAISRVTQLVESTHLLLFQDINVIHEFFENETINPWFFKTGKSELLNKHGLLCRNIEREIGFLLVSQEDLNFAIGDPIQRLKFDFDRYKSLTNKTVKVVLIRGFKDFGIEGSMRNYAHELEGYDKEIGIENILQLRRHEKDFIIRQEDQYIVKHTELIGKIENNLASTNSINGKKAQKVLELYKKEFDKLTLLEKQLGLKTGSGLKKELDGSTLKIGNALAALSTLSKQKEAAALVNVDIIYGLVGLMLISIGIFFSISISKKIARSTIRLKKELEEFVKSNFTERTTFPISNSSDEIDVLTTNFSIMEQHIVNQMNALKQTNKDLEMLFYVTSNDIRSPLIKVKQFTDLVLERTADPGTRADLSDIQKEWEVLLNIVDEIGIVTNIRSVEIKSERIDLEKLIGSVFMEFKSLKWFDNIIFSMDLSMKHEFHSSPGLVKAIFRNLIENSIKYATQRASFSFLKIAIVDQNEKMIRIEVTDNGIGIKEEYQDKIFDMFFRGTTHASGTGLGLYIVQCSLEKLNGVISVESSEEKGTKFSLLLPNRYEKQNVKDQIIRHREVSEMASISFTSGKIHRGDQ